LSAQSCHSLGMNFSEANNRTRPIPVIQSSRKTSPKQGYSLMLLRHYFNPLDQEGNSHLKFWFSRTLDQEWKQVQ
jgi:hypothetical protein